MTKSGDFGGGQGVGQIFRTNLFLVGDSKLDQLWSIFFGKTKLGSVKADFFR